MRGDYGEEGGREIILDAGCLYPELASLDSTLVVDRLDDEVARLVDSGTAVAWRVGGERSSEELAHTVMRTWKQWTFDGESPEPQIDLVAVGEDILTPNAAAELARTVRGAAALLHRN